MTRIIIPTEDPVEPVFRGLASGILTSIGFTVTVAKNHQEAMHLASMELPPTLCLVDWHLGGPTNSCLDIIRRLRARPGTFQTCICLWSMDRDRRNWNTAIHAGANAVLPKPLGPQHLWQLLSRLGVLQLPDTKPDIVPVVS